MSEEKRNFLFIGLVCLVVVGTPALFRIAFGPMQPPVRQAAERPGDVADSGKPGEATPAGEPNQENADAAKVAAQAVAPAVEKPAPAADEPEPELATRVLGSTIADSGYKMRVELTNEGAAVRKLELTDYCAEKSSDRLALLSVEDGEAGSLLLDVPGKNASLATRNWKIIADADDPMPDEASAAGDTQTVRFQTTLPGSNLVVTKTFRLKKGSHNLELQVEITNSGAAATDVTYILSGPRGFVLEGAWYSSKLRDAAIGDLTSAGLTRHPVTAATLDKGEKKILELKQGGVIPKSKWNLPTDWFDRFDANRDGKLKDHEIDAAAHALAGGERNRWEKNPVRYAGVDSQFFSALLVVPPPKSPEDRWDAATAPVFIGRDSRYPDRPERGDVSVEMQSREFPLAPGGSINHTYTLYAGPRKRAVLEQALEDPAIVRSIINYQRVLIFPDWMVAGTARTMLFFLDTFHGWVGNRGIAIIMLTVLVRLCLFPLSRKQAIRAQIMQQKMATLKPELDKLKEKFKNDVQKVGAAQFELYKKHGIDPRSQLAGCLPLLLQMPIFIGLWQGLSSSVDLRQAKFFLWIEDLSAPDQLFHFPWGDNAPIVSGLLGPYFNLLPAILIVLFLIQQKMFMPPQANTSDPQVEMQRKMMNVSLILFGYFMWRLPSGLCLYYIASTLWGITERKLLPKIQHATPQAAAEPERGGRDGGSRKGSRRDGRGPKSSNGEGLSLKDRFDELLKKASKK